MQCLHLLSATSLRDKGMKHLIGPDWRDLFDVIITNARKPKFFSDIQRYVVIFVDIEGDLKRKFLLTQLKSTH